MYTHMTSSDSIAQLVQPASFLSREGAVTRRVGAIFFDIDNNALPINDLTNVLINSAE